MFVARQLISSLQSLASVAFDREPSATNPRRFVDSTEELTLPQPFIDAPSEEIEVPRQTMAFPTPLSQMPYERLQRDEDEIEMPYIQRDATSTLSRMELPIYFRVEVFPPARNTECILIATQNRQLHGQGGDGITAYGAVHRRDFQFRTAVYGRWPRQTAHSRNALLRHGQWNEMSMAISETKATYWINGQRIATAHFANGEVASKELFLGVISYEAAFKVRRLDVSRDPRLLCLVCNEEEVRLAAPLREKIITLHAVTSDENLDVVSVVCTSIAGEQVATFERLSFSTIVGDIRNRLEVGLNEFTRVQLLLSDGTLLHPRHDGVALLPILQRSEASVSSE